MLKILSLLSTALMGASAPSAFGQSHLDANSERMVADMTRIISAHMVMLDQSVVTFHYEHDPRFNPQSLADVQKRALGWPETYFNPAKNPDLTAGPGTYVAIDPAGSRNFGTDRPQLTVFTLKAGTRVFATGAELTAEERATLLRLQEDSTCGKYQTYDLSLLSLITHFRYGELNCRELIIEATRRARVQAILYSYDSSNTLARCRTRGEAFNIISSDAFDVNQISYYEPGRAFEGRKFGAYLARLYPEAMRDFHSTEFANSNELSAPMPSTEAAAYPFYRGWKMKNLFKCGRVTAAERADRRILVHELLSRAMWDRRITDLFPIARAAFNRRGTKDRVIIFEYALIRDVERAEYLTLGFPADFSRVADFLNAKSHSAVSSPEDFAKIEALLGESGQHLPVSEEETSNRAWIATLSSSELNDPNLLYKQFRALGMGPRLAVLRANSVVKNEGGAPYIAEMPQEHAGPDSKRGYERSVQKMVEILTHCIKIYQDPRVTTDQVQAGACGVRQYGDQY